MPSQINPLLARSLQYVLLPGKPTARFSDLCLHDKAFSFWHGLWRKVLAEVGAKTIDLPADDFLRHEIIGLLMLEGGIIGQHACCFFDLALAATRQHSYIAKYFQGDPLARLEQLKLRQVISHEFLAVLPAWRSIHAGLSLANVLLALGCKIALAVKPDGLMGAARADTPVARFAYGMGGTALAQGILVHGRPTDLIYWTRDTIRRPDDKAVNALVRRLWITRIDMTGITSHGLGAVA